MGMARRARRGHEGEGSHAVKLAPEYPDEELGRFGHHASYSMWGAMKYVLVLSVLLWWLPTFGQMIAGYIGGGGGGGPGPPGPMVRLDDRDPGGDRRVLRGHAAARGAVHHLRPRVPGGVRRRPEGHPRDGRERVPRHDRVRLHRRHPVGPEPPGGGRVQGHLRGNLDHAAVLRRAAEPLARVAGAAE